MILNLLAVIGFVAVGMSAFLCCVFVWAYFAVEREARAIRQRREAFEADTRAVEERVIQRWADSEDARKARSVANRALLSRVTDEDRVEIAALIRNTGCRVGEWAA